MNTSKEEKGSILNSDAAPGILLLVATVAALLFANTPLKNIYYTVVYNLKIGEEFNIHFLVNDFLMAIFFIVVGCEIKREIVYGKLSSIKQAAFPVLAAVGGMAVPAIIFSIFNFNTNLEVGVGIPLSTDIAFAIGIFAILKDRVNQSLKIFLLTLAVVDDLLSIVIIGVFYSSHIRISGIVVAIILTIVLLCIRKVEKLNNLYIYLIVGLMLWLAMLYSGVHSTLSGVILAFCIPVHDEYNRHIDLNYKLQHALEGFSNFIILPLFAFTNTGIAFGGNLDFSNDMTLLIGIVLGLCVGKPLGIVGFGYIGNLLNIAKKPENSKWYDIFIVSVIAGIGFTMSLFITEIAFANREVEINVAKVSILVAAIVSILASYIFTMFHRKKNEILG